MFTVVPSCRCFFDVAMLMWPTQGGGVHIGELGKVERLEYVLDLLHLLGVARAQRVGQIGSVFKAYVERLAVRLAQTATASFTANKINK